MCKRLLTIVSVALGLGATGAAAQTLPPAEQAFFDQHIRELVTTQATRLTDADVAAVFAIPIYSVLVEIKEGDGSSRQTILVARVGEQLVGLFQPGEESDCPDIQKLFSPAFKLRGQVAAARLQHALDVVYPISSGGDEKTKAIRHVGNEWTFVRGTFFDKSMGFVLTTDASGKIVGVRWSLKLPG